MGKIKETLKSIDNIYFYVLLRLARNLQRYTRYKLFGQRKVVELLFKKSFKRKLDLNNPKTLNEKIQWLKINFRTDLQTTLADKYAAREWLAKKFGSEYLVPLIFSTTDWREVKPENISEVPCIIKNNNGSGTYYICRDKKYIDWKLRQRCKIWLETNYFYLSLEWQYKDIPPRIIVEKLLLTKEGKLPNDYKLHFFNGELKFVYCSIDREGGNFRNMYAPDWTPLYFTWGGHDEKRGPEIDPPKSFPKMLEIGSEIAKLFKYVRVDFYDVDGKLYYGEVTFHHGGGLNHFRPESYDKYFGDMLDLNAPVQEEI